MPSCSVTSDIATPTISAGSRSGSDLPNAAGGQVASFLVECLVYLVENEHFLVESDDLYARVRRIVLRMRELLGNPLISMGLREINDIKPLFGAGQAWSQPDAIKFVDAVVAHLGAA